MDKKMDEAEKDVKVAVGTLKLPEGADKPNIIEDVPAAAPVFQFALSSTSDNQSNISQYINERVKPALATVEGIGKVSISGETEKQVEVKIDPKKQEQKNITYEMIKQAILTLFSTCWSGGYKK